MIALDIAPIATMIQWASSMACVVCYWFAFGSMIVFLFASAEMPSSPPKTTSSDTCAVYVAEASNEMSFMSVSFYAGQNFTKGDTIPVIDLGIPLIDLREQNDLMHQNKIPNDLLGMLWSSSELAGGAQFEDGNLDRCVSLVSGLGFSGAENPGLANVRWDHYNILQRYHPSKHFIGPDGEGNLDDRDDATAAAISNYFGMQMKVIDNIPAGREIFPDPGDEFFEFLDQQAERQFEESEEEYAYVNDQSVSRMKYIRADSIMEQFHVAVENNRDFFFGKEGIEKNRLKLYWDMIRLELVEDEKVKRLLPHEATDVTEYVSSGGALHKNNPGIQRTIGYLKYYGTCADNIVVKPSTIRDAGRGAFAKRDIKKGDIVAPYPLLRLPEELLLMYDLEAVKRKRRSKHFTKKTSTDGSSNPQDGGVGLQRKRKIVTDMETNDEEAQFDVEAAQLLLNYVIGHPDTSMVFYPFGPGVNYINHATYISNKASKIKENVEMSWSYKPYHSDEGHRSFEAGMSTILARGTSPFIHVMDLIATRDIAKGQEIFMDYGPSFDQELKDQRRYFNPIDDDYVKSNVLNVQMSRSGQPYPTIEEVEDRNKSDPNNPFFPPDVETICYVDTINAHTINLSTTNTVDEKEQPYKMTIPKNIEFNPRSEVKLFGDASNFTADATEYRCKVLHRQKVENDKAGTSYLYLVRVLSMDGSSAPVSTTPRDEDMPYIVDVPHESILLADAPYTSAMHTLNTLRHYIEIPDAMFPDPWRDMIDGHGDEPFPEADGTLWYPHEANRHGKATDTNGGDDFYSSKMSQGTGTPQKYDDDEDDDDDDSDEEEYDEDFLDEYGL